jgi:hypothetical protein
MEGLPEDFQRLPESKAKAAPAGFPFEYLL